MNEYRKNRFIILRLWFCPAIHATLFICHAICLVLRLVHTALPYALSRSAQCNAVFTTCCSPCPALHPERSPLCPLPFPAVRCALHCLLHCLCLFLPCSALPCPAMPCHAIPCPAIPYLALSCTLLPDLPCSVTSRPAIPCSALSYPAQPHTFSFPALPCPALPCPGPPRTDLPWPNLPCAVLSCPTLPYSFLSPGSISFSA